jgi:hypothetical protein
MLETTIISSHKCNVEILVLEQTISFRIKVEFILAFISACFFRYFEYEIIVEKLHLKNTYTFLMPQNSTLAPNNLLTLKLHIIFHKIIIMKMHSTFHITIL